MRAHETDCVHLFFRTFWTFLRWSIEFLYVPPFLYGTLLLLLNVAVAAFRQRPLGAAHWKQHYSWMILQFLFFPATLAVAVVGQVSFHPENYWGLRAIDAFLFGSVAIAAWWVWRMKGFRWFAAGLAVLQLWVLAGAQFIAGMALTGDWL